MAEGTVSVNDSGSKLLRTNTRTVSAQTVHEEYAQLGEPGIATYATTTPTGGISIATANDHIVELMCGGSLSNILRRMLVYQAALATTAALSEWQLWRITTAGTGGTAGTTYKLDTTDAAASSTVMTLPTVKGTEADRVWTGFTMVTQTVPTAGGPVLLFDIDFDKLLRGKGLRIPSGTANGLALKCVTGNAAAKVAITTIWSEVGSTP